MRTVVLNMNRGRHNLDSACAARQCALRNCCGRSVRGQRVISEPKDRFSERNWASAVQPGGALRAGPYVAPRSIWQNVLLITGEAGPSTPVHRSI